MERHETWQVEVDGKLYETDLAGLTQWIAESSLLPDDKVRRGDLPWIEAKQVSALAPFFAGAPPLTSENAVSGGENFNPAEFQNHTNTTVNQAAPENFGSTAPATSTGFASPHQTTPVQETAATAPPSFPEPPPPAASKAKQHCAVHPEREAYFACRQCLSLFCESCPKTLARVKICPLCGDMCNPHGAGQPTSLKSPAGTKSFTKANPGPGSSNIDPNFTFEDFKAAWSYPFRFPVALIVGGIFSALLSFGIYLGLMTTVVGGLFPGLMTMLVCSVLSISLIYGCATKAVNQVAYGNMQETFMPDTEEFSIWNTILLPCFLGLGTCLVSWGPMLLVAVLIFRTIAGATADAQKEIKGPDAPLQTQNMKIQPDAEFGPREAMQTEIESNSRQSEANAIKRIQEISKTGKAAPMGFAPPKSPEEMQSEMVTAFLKKISGRVIPLILLLIAAALWGLFYFPTALTVAGYTESIGSTMNPLVGFDTMRRMGGNYLRAFGTYLLLLVFSFFIYFGVGIITAPLAALGFGNAPAQFLGNIVSFYLYIVTACIFGLALYRSHEKLGFSIS
jgi:hypothetical protein